MRRARSAVFTRSDEGYFLWENMNFERPDPLREPLEGSARVSRQLV